MKVLFLDDRQERIDVAKERYKDDDLIIVRTAEEAINELKHNDRWDLVCLDHDLNYEEWVNSNRSDCGMEVVRWMTGYRDPINKIVGKVIIHTSNCYAALEMYTKLKRRGYNVIYERFRYD